ncbi:bacteriophage abortive infection AbiH family protein [Lysinibacillus tabacifolii]|uniref:Uncharacterized protein n=1 Tax=Lysinibacillus tabacifolii TaxID=1173107 RepID=A0ABY2SY77_9BACI|nr:bacteriophage abortive infection AbiH family protein [Lysinibacillus tabacifolii]TKI48248.1 hypothetical protein FC748_11520 [Lysinibacillus tabacifolii]
MTKLFIIGNGFDVSHSLKTKYEHFKEYLLEKHPEITMDKFVTLTAIHDKDGGPTYNEVEVLSMLFSLITSAEYSAHIASKNKCIEYNGEWNEIEKSLGELDFSEAFDYIDDILDKDGDVDLFKTSYVNGDIAAGLVIPTITIQRYFSEWVNSISLDSVEPKLDFEKLIIKDDLFLTFNYTETLQEVYDISEDNICHIHGRQGEEIFFGHGNTQYYYEAYMQSHIGSESSLTEIDNQLRKQTQVALENNLVFFEQIESENINEIYSYGFSFSDVDAIYMEEIFRRINTENVIWYLNDYDKEIIGSQITSLKDLGFKGHFNTFSIKI